MWFLAEFRWFLRLAACGDMPGEASFREGCC